MSRVRVQEVSSPISLFPFIGILICTMGALLVVLVAVSRSARDSAVREVQSHDTSGAKVAIEGTFKKIDEVKTALGTLNTVRGQAETRLRDEQLRLGGVEDHIRQLRERIAVLQSADVELKALEQEHYDDHQQAEREIDRLHKLITDSQKTVNALQEAGKSSKKSYAVVPYEGPNGTFRRPIYIECTKSGLTIQPEGVHISEDDVRPPLTPGNPLATALRATRDYLLRLNPQSGKSRDTEPYALLLVRPEGDTAFYAARQAIEVGDFDLGYELIEQDWKIKYPEPDAQLAGIQTQALEQARARQQLLAAAAPRVFGDGTIAASGGFDDDSLGEDGGGGSGGRPSAGGGRTAGVPRDYLVHKNDDDGDIDADDGNGGSSESASASVGRGSAPVGPSTSGSPTGGSNSAANGPALSGAGQSGIGGSAPSAAMQGGGSGGLASNVGNGSPPPGSPPDKSLTPDGYQNGGTAVAGSPAAADSDSSPPGASPRSEKERAMAPEKRGKDWALKQKPPRAIQVRRTIRVVVTKNQLTIAPDSGPVTAGKVVPLPGDTVESVDEFVKQVRDHIDGWGIAGTNLYWRPVVVLNVGPDGQQRASDLARLLKNSGLELRADETAKNSPQGGAHETR